MWAQRKYIDDQVRETRGIDRQKKNGTKGRDKKIDGVLTHSMAGNEQIEVELDSGGD
jgi:hypothetical protein